MRKGARKTVLVVDGATNCAYDCFIASPDLFAAIFPAAGQDIAFIDEVLANHPGGTLDAEFDAKWGRRVPKALVRGIDGVLFYELELKKQFYPNRRDSDLDGIGRSHPAVPKDAPARDARPQTGGFASPDEEPPSP